MWSGMEWYGVVGVNLGRGYLQYAATEAEVKKYALRKDI